MSEHDDLDQRITELRGFEVEYRQRLRMHLEDCLATLDRREVNLALRAAARRLAEAPDADLREVLTELPEAKRQRLLAALLRLHVAEVKA